MNRPNHFEIYTDDPEAVQPFYRDVFDWTFQKFEGGAIDYWLVTTGDDQMREWYFDLKQFKPKVGFAFEFVVEHEGNNYHHLCRIVEVIPERKIAYTWCYKGEPGDSLVSIELSPEGEKTLLKMTHT